VTGVRFWDQEITHEKKRAPRLECLELKNYRISEQGVAKQTRRPKLGSKKTWDAGWIARGRRTDSTSCRSQKEERG